MEAAFQAGDVVYFLTPDKRSVDFGICKDFYCDGYGLSPRALCSSKKKKVAQEGFT